MVMPGLGDDHGLGVRPCRHQHGVARVSLVDSRLDGRGHHDGVHGRLATGRGGDERGREQAQHTITDRALIGRLPVAASGHRLKKAGGRCQQATVVAVDRHHLDVALP